MIDGPSMNPIKNTRAKLPGLRVSILQIRRAQPQ